MRWRIGGHVEGMPEEFSNRVRELAGFADAEDARRVATAVLGALGSQLTGSAARQLAAPLPEAFAQPLTQTDEVAHGGGMDEFYTAVEERSGLRDAPAAVGAVLRALAETADPGAVSSAREQLPAELRILLETGVRESPTSQTMAAGPIEPDAENVAGPDRPLR
jgi:uncharacterized protein (DUF2267 family)